MEHLGHDPLDSMFPLKWGRIRDTGLMRYGPTCQFCGKSIKQCPYCRSPVQRKTYNPPTESDWDFDFEHGKVYLEAKSSRSTTSFRCKINTLDDDGKELSDGTITRLQYITSLTSEGVDWMDYWWCINRRTDPMRGKSTMGCWFVHGWIFPEIKEISSKMRKSKYSIAWKAFDIYSKEFPKKCFRVKRNNTHGIWDISLWISIITGVEVPPISNKWLDKEYPKRVREGVE